MTPSAIGDTKWSNILVKIAGTGLIYLANLEGDFCSAVNFFGVI